MIHTKAMNEQDAARLALADESAGWTDDEKTILAAMAEGRDEIQTSLCGTYRRWELPGNDAVILTHEAVGGYNVGAVLH